MKYLLLTFALIIASLPAFAADPSDAVKLFGDDKAVQAILDAKVAAGYTVNTATASLIYRSHGDEGFFDRYLVTTSANKKVNPYEVDTQIISAIVSIEALSQEVRIMDSDEIWNKIKDL